MNSDTATATEASGASSSLETSGHRDSCQRNKSLATSTDEERLRALPLHFEAQEAEARWDESWQRSGIFRYDPTRPREETFGMFVVTSSVLIIALFSDRYSPADCLWPPPRWPHILLYPHGHHSPIQADEGY